MRKNGPRGELTWNLRRTSASLVLGSPPDSATLPSGPPSGASGLRRQETGRRLCRLALWRRPRKHFGLERLGPGAEAADVILSPTPLCPTPERRSATPALEAGGDRERGLPQRQLLQSPGNHRVPASGPSPSLLGGLHAAWPSFLTFFHLPTTDTC